MNVSKIQLIDVPAIDNTAKRLLFASDIHLGHGRTPTSQVIDSLNINITNTEMFAKIDGLIISGDLFDHLLSLPINDLELIYEWAAKLFKLSKGFNVPVRILEGTPSHDWKQSRIFEMLNRIFEKGGDVKFIDELSIVDDEALGMTIGYVPDEWRETCEQTTKEFQELMITRGYDEVDIIVMHGMFTFQVPKAAAKSNSYFDEAIWQQWARIAIVIGHDHRFKHYGKIVVPSSIERLSHNEEEAKGFLIMDIYHHSVQTYHVENNNAMLYITVGGVDKADTEIYAEAELALQRFYETEDIPLGRLKVKYNRKYDISAWIKDLRVNNPKIVIESASESEEMLTLDDVDVVFSVRGETINIDEKNIAGILLRELELEGDCSTSEDILKEIAFIQNNL